MVMLLCKHTCVVGVGVEVDVDMDVPAVKVPEGGCLALAKRANYDVDKVLSTTRVTSQKRQIPEAIAVD